MCYNPLLDCGKVLAHKYEDRLLYGTVDSKSDSGVDLRDSGVLAFSRVRRDAEDCLAQERALRVRNTALKDPLLHHTV